MHVNTLTSSADSFCSFDLFLIKDGNDNDLLLPCENFVP